MSDDFEHLRKLSEAGVARRMSSELVLTSDTDSFMVGETVYVGGTLPGKIAYIGETCFASGEWAGVSLDEELGKHNGWIGGHQYFQCNPGHGVFSRLTRLSRERLGSPPPHERERSSAERSQPGSRRTSRSSPGSVLPPGTVLPPSGRRSSSPNKVALPTRRSSSHGEVYPHFHHANGTPPDHVTSRVKVTPDHVTSRVKVTEPPPRAGDRVSVSSLSVGRKLGTARFVGETEFAEGTWVGIQLDEPRGRNDGSVAGKRYFESRPHYGLFAPLARVTLVQRRPSGELDRRRSHTEFRSAHCADEDGYY